MTLVDQCAKRGCSIEHLAKPRAISPPPSSRQGRSLPLGSGKSTTPYVRCIASFDDQLKSAPSIHIRCKITPPCFKSGPLCDAREQHVGCLIPSRWRPSAASSSRSVWLPSASLSCRRDARPSHGAC